MKMPTLPSGASTYAALLAGVIALLSVWRIEERRAGALAERLKGLEGRNQALNETVRMDSVALAKRDTLRLFRSITHTDSVIQHIVDTAVVHHFDSVFVPVRVLVQADSELKACRETVRDCVRLEQDLRKQLAVKDSIARVVKAEQPSRLIPHTGVGVAAGLDQTGKPRIVAGIFLGWKIP